jgi:hypothetical protein
MGIVIENEKPPIPFGLMNEANPSKSYSLEIFFAGKMHDGEQTAPNLGDCKSGLQKWT